MAKLDSKDIMSVKGKGFLFVKGSEDLFNGRVVTGNGYITAQQMKVIGEAADKYGDGNIAFTSRMCVEIQNIPFDNIQGTTEYVEKCGLLFGGTGDKVRPVTACKGKTCVFGLVPSSDIAQTIHERFYDGYRNVELPHKFKIGVGGCPNNCIKPDLNDVGLIGQRMPEINIEKCKLCGKCSAEASCLVNAFNKDKKEVSIDREICNNCGKCIGNCVFDAVEEKQYGVKILIGGRWGRSGRKGTELRGIYSIEESLDVIEAILLYYRENAFKKERFADMIDRIGFEKVQEDILCQNILDRKNDIISKEITRR